MSRSRQRMRDKWLWTRLLSFAVIALCSSTLAFGNERTEQLSGGVETATAIPLEYRETRYPILLRNVRVSEFGIPFEKKPKLVRGREIRGILNFGNNPSNAIPFVWNVDKTQLYLDLDRDRDFSENHNEAFSGFVTGPRIPTVAHQIFTNIHLRFPASSAGSQLLVDFCFLQSDDSIPLVNVAGRSFWEGKLKVSGTEWQVGLIQNLSDQPGSFDRGQVLIRPWEERDRPFCGWSSSEDSWATPFELRNRFLKAADAFKFSPQIFFGGSAWRLNWRAEPNETHSPFALSLLEQKPALGLVEISGRFIERVVLTGGAYSVVLVRPARAVTIPVGTYDQPSVRIKQGDLEAYFDSLPKSGQGSVPDKELGGVRPVSGVIEADKVSVTQSRPAVLEIGGPLTNSVSVAPHGRDLVLTYRLIGVGGGNYKLVDWWKRNGGAPPQFAVTSNRKEISSGQFEFG